MCGSLVARLKLGCGLAPSELVNRRPIDIHPVGPVFGSLDAIACTDSAAANNKYTLTIFSFTCLMGGWPGDEQH